MTPIRPVRASGKPSLSSPGGWPRPPRFAQIWMTRRALWWFRLMRAGQVHRLVSDVRAQERFASAMEARSRLPGASRERVRLAEYGRALRLAWRARAEAGPLGPALARADHPNYLGAVDVVRGLVDAHVGLLIARRAGTEADAMCAAEAEHLTRIFGGEDPDFAPIGAWNTRDQLGDSCIRRCPLDPARYEGEELAAVLGATFAVLADAVARTVHAAGDGHMQPDEALDRLVRIAAFTTAMLMGLADAEPEEMTLQSLAADLPAA